MKGNNSIFVGWQGVVLAVVVIAAGLPGPAYCETDGTALLLQQTPARGGEVSLGVGVHHFALNTEVTLTAVPKPGYQFVYWLGDVSDPTASSTIVYLDVPKIVIAIFERLDFDFELLVEEGPQSSFGGGRGLRRSAADYARGGGGGAGGRRPIKWRWPEWEWPEWEEGEQPEKPNDFAPVPKDGNDFPVPGVPEPAAGVLLALGSLFVFTRRRAEK